MKSLIQKIKQWLIKVLGGHTHEDYIKDISLLDKGFVLYDATIYEPVRVSSRLAVSSKDISGFSHDEVVDYMSLVENKAACEILDGIMKNKILTITRSEDALGDLVIEASLNVLVPKSAGNKLKEKE